MLPRRRQVGHFTGAKGQFPVALARQFHIDRLRRRFEREFKARHRADGGAVLRRFRDEGVVAFDLAGGEAGRPCGAHADAFDLAQEGRLGITVHAGEAAGAESIAEAIDLCHADRIGHGTRLFEDERLRDYVRDRRIALEINITSNLQTHAVTDAAAHPVRDYFDRGLNVTLCTDSWLMCGVSLTDEYWLAHTALGFTRAEIDRMILNGFESAFLAWPERERLVASVRDELAAIR